MTQTAELACTYAALILHDDGQDITGDKISKLVNASGVKIESYWPKLFAKALEGQSVASFFNFGGSSEGTAAQPAAKVVEAPKVEAKKEQPKKKKQQPKVQEQEQGGMGGLFD